MRTFLIPIILCLPLLLVGTIAADPFANQSEPATLKFGESCNYEMERTREIYYSFISGSKQKNQSEVDEATQQFQNEIKAIGEPLCSGQLLLQCSKEDGKCGCGDAGLQALFGTRMSEFFVSEGDKCKEAEGAGCPKEKKKGTGFGCPEDAAKCIGKEDGKLCTLQTIQDYADKNSRFQADLMEDLYEGKICSCES